MMSFILLCILAKEEVKATRVRTIDWNNIGHPVTEIVSHMFLARSCYGVLSSGTRSYFFKVEVTDDVPRVLITDAWFVGQKDFLQAWAYVYHLAKRDGDFQPPHGGFQEWPTWTAGSPPDRNQPSGRYDPSDLKPRKVMYVRDESETGKDRLVFRR